ncbi:MAG: ABC transporter permease [Chloroflexota bacterium]
MTSARLSSAALKAVLPLLSILGLWYLAIYTSGYPAFVIPRPERVAQVLYTEGGFIFTHLIETLKVALLGILLANVVGLGLAVLFLLAPVSRDALMPAAIAVRNIPFVALATILILAFGDSIATKVAVTTLAGFFPVLVNCYRGLQAVDTVVLDRMRLLNASPFELFAYVRLPFALPYFIAAQEITCTSAIIVTIAAEWLTSQTGLGYVINRAMSQYRGDTVYAVSFLAAILSFTVYSVVRMVGRRLSWGPGREI